MHQIFYLRVENPQIIKMGELLYITVKDLPVIIFLFPAKRENAGRVYLKLV
jgi:hypothetical protein